jgi:hypothetical protein
MNTEKSGGNKIKDSLRLVRREHDGEVGPLSEVARRGHDKGGAQPQWPVIDEIRDRMMTGRFKVFSHLGVVRGKAVLPRQGRQDRIAQGRHSEGHVLRGDDESRSIFSRSSWGRD